MNTTINLDPTNGTANITLHDPVTGVFANANMLKLGPTGHMTIDQAEAHARHLAKDALLKAAAAL